MLIDQAGNLLNAWESGNSPSLARLMLKLFFTHKRISEGLKGFPPLLDLFWEIDELSQFRFLNSWNFYQILRKGLVKAARTTGAWIFTGGTNTGEKVKADDSLGGYLIKLSRKIRCNEAGWRRFTSGGSAALRSVGKHRNSSVGDRGEEPRTSWP